MGLWWLSFSDPERPKGQKFVGVALIETAHDPPDFKDAMKAAITKAWTSGCNPGGDVAAGTLDLDHMPNERRVLLARAPKHVLLDRELLLHYDLIDRPEGD